MPTSVLEGDKIYLQRTAAERRPILDRLSRLEGQIRGVRAMVEADRYCPDELHQIKAAISALKQVAIILAEQHIAAAAEKATVAAHRDDAHADMMRVINELLKF